ncbi:MAG: hypothetical protein J6O51_08930 [Bacteroidales bacterium]|nr:hypothetical protein [Bacteroidales bacterium]
MWISPKFGVYLIREFQRLNQIAIQQMAIWTMLKMPELFNHRHSLTKFPSLSGKVTVVSASAFFRQSSSAGVGKRFLIGVFSFYI